MQHYKNQILTITNWLIIGLIVWLWIQFAVHDNDTFASSFTINNTASVITDNTNESIEKYHIFGAAQQLTETPLMQGNTSLNLVLTGTMSNPDVNTGLAYISNVQGVQKIFKVGDKVFEMAKLKEIYKDYVVLNHNGRNERLSISEQISGITTSKRPTTKKNPAPAYLKHLNGNQQRNWQEMLDTQKFDANKISSIVGNVNLVTDQTGKIQGLRVSNLADGNMLAKHGLKSNDIITAINGNRVSAKNMLSIKQTLQQNPNATVTIKRNGKVQNVQINLNNL